MQDILRNLKRQLINKNYTRYVILTGGRTGSTMLTSCLERHYQIESFGEVFNLEHPPTEIERREFRDNYPSQYLEKYIFKEYARKTRAVGFKLIYYHLLEEQRVQVRDYLLSHDCRIIHLIRQNILALLVSSTISKKENRWHVYENEDASELEPHSITIPVETFVSFADAYVAEVRRNHELYSKAAMIYVYYEDLASETNKELQRISRFLNVRIEDDLRPKTKKRVNQPLWEIIKNYQELMQIAQSYNYQDWTSS